MLEPCILVVDDDADLRTLLKRFLEKNGYRVTTADTGEGAIEALRESRPDLVLCDHRLPDTDSVQLILRIHAIHIDVPVIVITGYSDVPTAVELMRRGAFDYVVKPLYPDEILLSVKEALGSTHLNEELKPVLERTPATPKPLPSEFIAGPSRLSSHVRKQIQLAAPANISVLITGRTGTGKEFVAKALHDGSSRAKKPFVAVDCGALPRELAVSELFGHVKGAFTGAVDDRRGCFEQAHGGTIFLDEVGNLSYENQVNLLRVLQERCVRRLGGEKDIAVDVRVLAATNVDLTVEIAEGRFREDLFHRINEFYIRLSPLRERPEDIPVFARHFLKAMALRLGKEITDFDPQAMQCLLAHPWHGNLRELANVVKRAALFCTGAMITIEHLPIELTTAVPAIPATDAAHPSSLEAQSSAAERSAILEALKMAHDNKTVAAQILRIDRKTLYNKAKLLGMDI